MVYAGLLKLAVHLSLEELVRVQDMLSAVEARDIDADLVEFMYTYAVTAMQNEKARESDTPWFVCVCMCVCV